jgi:hypothetical protein
VSEEARDFCLGLLTQDPFTRLTAEQALAHPWLAATAESKHKRSKSKLVTARGLRGRRAQESAFLDAPSDSDGSDGDEGVYECDRESEGLLAGGLGPSSSSSSSSPSRQRQSSHLQRDSLPEGGLADIASQLAREFSQSAPSADTEPAGKAGKAKKAKKAKKQARPELALQDIMVSPVKPRRNQLLTPTGLLAEASASRAPGRQYLISGDGSASTSSSSAAERSAPSQSSSMQSLGSSMQDSSEVYDGSAALGGARGDRERSASSRAAQEQARQRDREETRAAEQQEEEALQQEALQRDRKPAERREQRGRGSNAASEAAASTNRGEQERRRMLHARGKSLFGALDEDGVEYIDM